MKYTYIVITVTHTIQCIRGVIQYYSWLQQDPGEILQAVKDCIEDVCQQCEEKNISLTSIKGTT